MTVKPLPARVEKSTEKPKRNRLELSITNGFEFGIGFWLAGVFIMLFGVPAIACAVVMALALIGQRPG